MCSSMRSQRNRRRRSLVLAGAPFERFRDRERVVVTGFVDDDELAALYRGAIALVMPSREEGFGLPALEAMACGCAVITSNAAALVEITGDAALHVDADDRCARDAMQRVASDEALRATLASRGIERAKTLHVDALRGAHARRVSRRDDALKVLAFRGTDVEHRVSITIFINNCLTI